MSVYDRFRYLIPLYAVGALEGPERDEVIEHLYSCDACMSEFDHHMQVVERLASEDHPDPGLWQRIEARL